MTVAARHDVAPSLETRIAAQRARTRRYYAEVAYHYLRYSPRVRGWHYGIWDHGVWTNEQAVARANVRLMEGLALRPGLQVLDVGCGVGGLAVWLARTFGCRVTAMNIVPEHLARARQTAQRHGVAEQCRFILMDLSRLAFRHESFDVVINQETFCYALDPRAYLESVWRVLRPGGQWRAMEPGLQAAPLSAEERQLYETQCAGFHIPALLPPGEVLRLLQDAGYQQCEAEDITAQVLPSARYILRHCVLPLLACRMGLDWLRFSRDPRRRANHQGNFHAAAAYSRGLLRGCFRHSLYRARKPG